MEEHSGVDKTGGRWTQITIGKLGLREDEEDSGLEDAVAVYLWRRIPTPVPPRMTEADYRFTVVIEGPGGRLVIDVDDADRLAEGLPALLHAAAARGRQG